ncbi:MAG: hypothetical protein IJ325_05010 [Clostridia bacterium]|nr:hypothetical protein [Clostridia bacterium]
MSEVFLKMINMSITASWLVLAVFILRFVLKKAPKWGNVLLWGIVAVRLLFPFSIESALSLIPSTQTIPLNIELNTVPAINSGIPVINNVVNPIIVESNTPAPGTSVNPLQIAVAVCANIWILGIAAMLLYTTVSYLHLRRRVGSAVLYRDNIFQSENVDSPFVLGIVKPRIYTPFGLDDHSLEYVIAHEQAHIRRRDHWWKPFGFLLLAVHWFNPILWLAYVLFCRDIELACDEKVIREMDDRERANYSQALLDCSVNRRLISACPLAFGEVGVRARIKSVLHYKKPAFWIILLALLVCAVTAVCFLTDPVTVRNPWVQEYEPGAENSIGSVDKEKYESISADFSIGADKYGRAVFKDPEKAFDTLKILYAEGIALIREEQGLGALSHRNFDLYKKFGWQVTGGTEEAREQAAFVSRFLDIYENSFTKDTPNTDLPEVTREYEWEIEMLLVSNISPRHLTYEELKNQQEEIWEYTNATVSASQIIEYQQKIESVDYRSGDQYVTVYVRDFTDEDIQRFEKTFGHFSYVLVQIPMEWIRGTAWEWAQQIAEEKGLTLDRSTEHIVFIETGRHMGAMYVDYSVADSISWIRVYFYRDENGNYVPDLLNQRPWVPNTLVDATISVTLDVPYAVPEAVLSLGAGLVKQEVYDYNQYATSPYSLTGAKITALERIAEVETEPDCAVEMYRLEYKVIPDDPDTALEYGRTMDNGCINEPITAGQPYLVMYRSSADGTDVYTRISISDSLLLPDYETAEMLTEYGDPYTAMAMELYERFISMQEVTFPDDITDTTEFNEENQQLLFGTPTSWFYDTAWAIAMQTAAEQGLTLDKETGTITHSENGEYVGVEYYEADGVKHVRVAFFRDENGEYSTQPTPSSDVPASLLQAAYETACGVYDGVLSDTPYAIRGSVNENYLEIIFQAADKTMYVGALYVRNSEKDDWIPMPGTPTVIYDPTRWDNTESMIISIDFDYAVPQAVTDWAAELVKQEIDNHNILNSQPDVTTNAAYSIVGAKITGLRKLAEADTSTEEDCAVEIYLLEYRLKPDHPENVPAIEGMVMEDGWITESFRGCQPYLILYRNSTSGTDVYTRITTADSGMILESADEETMQWYYAELAKDLYEAWRRTQEVTFTGIITDWNIVSPDEDGVSILDLNMVEFITSEDTERIKELELNWQDMPNGYYIHDPDDQMTTLKLPENTEFVFYDWWDIFNTVEDPRYTVTDGRWITTSDSATFAEYLKTYDPHPGMPFIFTATEERLTIQEIFVP